MFKQKIHRIIFLAVTVILFILIPIAIHYSDQTDRLDNKPFLITEHDNIHEKVDPKDFGAVGDGITDDTKALQAWLDAPGKNKVLKNGVFKITSGLRSSEAGRTIKTDGAVIIADTANMIMLTVTGEQSIVSVDLNGNNKAAGGILILGDGCQVQNSKIDNIYGSNQTAFGIKAQTSNGVLIEQSTIKNIRGTKNGKFGDNIGASRAILVTSKEAASKPNIIRNNSIDGVTGEEGDAIQFLFNNGQVTFLNAQGMIENNMIKNCNRRAIKVQASNVKILNNTHINTLSKDDLPHAANLIDIIHSNFIIVQGNKLDATFFLGISLSGDSTRKASGILVKGNIIQGGLVLLDGRRVTASGIYWNNITDSQIIANSIADAVIPISGANGTNITVADNRFWGGDGLYPAINILSSNTNIHISDNKQMAGRRSTLIRNNSLEQ